MNYIKQSEKEILKLVNENILICNMNLWKLVIIKGKNFKSYIQNHITCDLNLINKNKFKFCANPNYNGKIYSIICLFYHKNNLFYIINNNIYDKHILKIKKYDIFSDINLITNHNFILLGLIGKNSYEFLKKNIGFFKNKSENVYFLKDISILNLSNEKTDRFILVSSKKIINNFIKNILYYKKNIFFVNNIYWLYLDIISGYPIISNINIEKFFPQELGMNNLNSISFEKGCYMGQEIISKIHFLKLQRMYLSNLYGYFDITPCIGNKLEIITNKGFIKQSGIILFYIILKNKNILVQSVILNSDFSNTFRIKNSVFNLSVINIFK